jgi:nucleoid-associated protein YgaU
MAKHSRKGVPPTMWLVVMTLLILAAGITGWEALRVTSSSKATPSPTLTLTAPQTSDYSGSGANGSHGSTVPRSTPTPSSSQTAASSPSASISPSPKQPSPVSYTVVPGDTLSSIAIKFKQAGYQPLYDWNATVIGQNPNLIKPGQVIIVALAPIS